MNISISLLEKIASLYKMQDNKQQIFGYINTYVFLASALIAAKQEIKKCFHHRVPANLCLVSDATTGGDKLMIEIQPDYLEKLAQADLEKFLQGWWNQLDKETKEKIGVTMRLASSAKYYYEPQEILDLPRD